MNLGERQEFGAIIGCVLLVGVPAVVGAALLFATVWVLMLGGHPHGMLWGWLSTAHTDSHGNTSYTPNYIAPAYLFGVVNLYIIYQCCELLYAAYRALHQAMT